MRSTRVVLTFAVAWLALMQPSAACAFSEPQIYADPPETGGGGGRWFTGSPAEGYDCSVCHTGRAPQPLYQTGLPLDGWVPGERYTIKLTWPEAAAAAATALAAGQRPSTSLVAELIAEDGSPSGTLELEPSFASRAELCSPAADSGAMLAASVFAVDGDVPVQRGRTCTAAQRNQRCLVAVAPCGSSELRVRWTAPERWGGPIWFAASLVSTLDATGIPDDDADSVTSLLIPISAARDPLPRDVALSGGCNVEPSPPLDLHILLSLLGLRLLVGASRKLRRTLLAALLGAGCQAPVTDAENVGLFTPGYRTQRSASPADGGAKPEELMCMGQTFDADGGAGHPRGSLQIDFTTGLLPAGDYDKAGMQENYGVVWVEDDTGRYVSGLSQWGSKYRLRLTAWHFGSGRTPATPLKGRFGCSDPDLVTSATLHTHAAHSVSWNGTDTSREVVPDGNYTLWFEVQIDERHVQSAVTFPFVKGRSPWTLVLPPAAPLQALTLTYTPES